MSAETLNVGKNHQIQEENELVSFFRNLQRPKAALSWGQGGDKLAKKHLNPPEAQ